MHSEEVGYELIRHAAAMRRPLVVLARAGCVGLAGAVRAALAMTGRMENLPEVRLKRYDRRIPFEAEARRILPRNWAALNLADLLAKVNGIAGEAPARAP